MQQMRNAMSVDVEDYFQVSAFEKAIPRSQWDSIPCRTEANVDKILALFDEKNIKATFFTLGWMAQRYPEMVKKIVAEGHELASHGWEHTRVTQQNSSQFSEDIINTKNLLEDLGGVAVQGYRAASYSIMSENLWALDCLADAGYKYSSSIVPIHHDLYGIPDAPRFAFRAASDRLLEIPITTLPVLGKNLNCGGGGWFRLFPYGFSKWALKQINKGDNEPGIFYFHPWEVDPEQPRVEQAGWKSRFRHYLNLDKMYGRLAQLIDDFQWGRVDDIFLPTAHQRPSIQLSSSTSQL